MSLTEFIAMVRDMGFIADTSAKHEGYYRLYCKGRTFDTEPHYFADEGYTITEVIISSDVIETISPMMSAETFFNYLKSLK